MTDDPHPASAAWQDVKAWEAGLFDASIPVYRADVVDDARAADAQQHAEQAAIIDTLTRTVNWQAAALVEREQQIAALRAENEQLERAATLSKRRIDFNENAAQQMGLAKVYIHRLEQQIAALRAELSGIDSLLDRRDALADVQGRTNKILSIIAAAKSADPKADSIRVVTLTARNQELEAQLTALQAEQAQWQRELLEAKRDANLLQKQLDMLVQLAALTAQQDKPQP